MTHQAVKALGKYMTMRHVDTSPSGKTHVFVVEDTHGRILGKVKWYSTWRRYCLLTSPDCVFSADCLTEIASALNELMREKAA